ncbi:hypothetical protein [Halobellus ordinarius]|uniref:hypothetical protein n=1 Tax=Halobellus ordinarius TaxID=3075120 RepID=UPI00288041BB|nr:hypothetical protein [Halobellus sp. ZY16]
MNASLEFRTAPPLVEWQTALVERGWKVTERGERVLTAKRSKGAMEHPVAMATTWYVTVRREGTGGAIVEIRVPAFTDAVYARKRAVETIDELAESVSGACEPDVDTGFDVLGQLLSDTRQQRNERVHSDTTR